MERIHVHLITHRADSPRRDFRSLFEPIRLPWHHWLFIHPDDHRVEFLLDPWYVAGTDNHIPAADVDLVLERQRDGLRCERLGEFAVIRHDALYAAPLP